VPRRPKLRCLTCSLDFIFRGEIQDLPGVILEWGICPHCNEPLYETEAKVITCEKCQHEFKLIRQPSARRPPTEAERRRQGLREINEHRDFMTKASGILDVFKCPECGGEMMKDSRVCACSEGPMMICESCKFRVRATGLTSRMGRITPEEREITEFLSEAQEMQAAQWPERKVYPDRAEDPRLFRCSTCQMSLNHRDEGCICTDLQRIRHHLEALHEKCISNQSNCSMCPLMNERCLVQVVKERFQQIEEESLEEKHTDPG